MAYRLPPNALYAFQLPPDLLAALQPRSLVIPADHPLHPSHRTDSSRPASPSPSSNLTTTTPATPATGYTCALTGASFPTLDGLRHHYHTDWYRYNVKLRLEGKPTPVSEEEFNRLVDNLSASISGSDAGSGSDASSSYDNDDEDSSGLRSDMRSDSDPLSRVLRKAHLHTRGSGVHDDDVDDGSDNLLAGPRSALQWFEAPTVASDTQYGIARAALPDAGARKRALPGAEEGCAVLDELRQLQLTSAEEAEAVVAAPERTWTLLMFGGGHFAGMVVQLRPKLVRRGKGQDKEREVVVLAKKTFHRYTTRRKQGGAQSANDAGKGKAKSAGAMIRRHNEAALTDEVRELLGSWADEIRSSELIFLRCSRNNYRTFFDYDENAPLQKGDPRIRGFGFPTKRPTLNELMRAFVELTRVKVSHLSASALAALDASYLASIAPKPTAAATASASRPPTVTSKPSAAAEPVLTPAEELERDRWTRLVEMVRKGRVDALRAFLAKYGQELQPEESQRSDSTTETAGLAGSEEAQPRRGRGELPVWWDTRERERTPTLLHCAAAADQPQVVRFFLLDGADADATSGSTMPDPEKTASSRWADPTYVSPQGRTPYELAPSRPTRNHFRFAAFRDPARYDWAGAARVPSGLDEAVELEKERREEERRVAAREREQARVAQEEEAKRAAAEVEQQRVRDAQARTPTLRMGAQRLGGGPPAVIQDRQRSGLSEEQKRRIEREERARAAEARLRRLGG